VRAIAHTDKELNFLDESQAPSVSGYRQQLFALLPDAHTNSQPHEDIIHNLDVVSKTFRVLIIKTNMGSALHVCVSSTRLRLLE
jgi:hypothetical protein